jgi:hypothetical protein
VWLESASHIIVYQKSWTGPSPGSLFFFGHRIVAKGQGDTLEELLQNLHEAVEGCLSVEVGEVQAADGDRVLEIAI